MASPDDNAIDSVGTLLSEYLQFLSGKAEGTIDAYLRTARQLIGWLARHPGNGGQFQPQQLTKEAVEQYLTHLEDEGLSLSHLTRVKSTISNFAQFLIEEKGLMQRNPTRGIDLPSMPMLVPQLLSQEQRSLLRSLAEQEGDRRGAALFALGYWAGCRVRELSWLLMADTHVGLRNGWLHIGDKGSKGRDIGLLNNARKPLYAYLQATSDIQRTYVFSSQRSERLTEQGIYYWFRTLKAKATDDQQEVIEDISFHDLQRDFAHRAREAGWSLEKVADYLGISIKQEVPAIQTTASNTPVSWERVKRKLKDIEG